LAYLLYTFLENISIVLEKKGEFFIKNRNLFLFIKQKKQALFVLAKN